MSIVSGSRSGCTISPHWPLVSDGGERARRRRRTTNQATMTTARIKTAPTTPPATPPASVPVFELLSGVEVGDRSSDVLMARSVCDICVTWIVNVGAVEPVPVTSGLSIQDECLCVSRAQGTPIAPPLFCAAFAFQLPSNCKGTVDETSWESK